MYKTIDLCAGIGGIRRGFELTGRCRNVLSAEIDEYAAQTYEHLYGENPRNDLTSKEFKKKAEQVGYDILLAGFPCQAFSSAGLRLGFEDKTKGTIFFDIAEIIKKTKPKEGILIAPACVIERGYNIVDISGNAWFDTVMFLVRPMVDPSDYNVHVQKVNGYIMNHYTGLNYRNRIDVMDQMRKEAFDRYAKLNGTKGSLSDLPEEMRIDAIASLFVVIEQVFGRLCRLGSTLKEKYPTIYWVDGAFNASEEGKFDTLKELEKYLENLMEHSHNPLVAKTLYEPFYQALKGERI